VRFALVYRSDLFFILRADLQQNKQQCQRTDDRL
jgi:hypothetical protein